MPTAAEIVHELSAQRRVPTATYRFQFRKEFTFAQAAALVPYLHDLGISDVYASPILQATPGSAHGYDTCDHSRINPELGGESGLDELVTALRSRGMGLLLDVVPNHMGIAHPSNRWWMDVLENGASSSFSPYFDVDWKPVNPELENKVLLPILGEQYGQVLESGQIQVRYEAGSFFLLIYGNKLPLAPRTYSNILRARLERLADNLGEAHEAVQELRSILTALSHLPPRAGVAPDKIVERNREKEIAKRRIAALVKSSADVRAAVEESVALYNGKVGQPASFDRLDSLIDAQCYRPAFWKVAMEEINYRRFFDVNELAAIRPEEPEVFQATHHIVLRLLAEGKATGLRIDHPDGLWSPTHYFRQLQESYVLDRAPVRLQGRRSSGRLAAEIVDCLNGLAAGAQPPAWPLYIVAEKILSKDEPLPTHWAVAGTTGYDFLNAANGLFVAADNANVFDRIYRDFAGGTTDMKALVNSRKKMIMLVSMASEINALSHRLDRIAERNRDYRDFTLNSLTFAIREIIAALPIYRTYLNPNESVTPRDRQFIEATVAQAKDSNPRTAGAVFDFIRDTLLFRNHNRFHETDRPLLTDWVMRFQQLTGPIMAKGVEDTAFYVFNRLASLNEVGGHPEHFGLSVSDFHAENLERHKHWPHSLLATSTHDTKRSEDVRARIDVLSEFPEEWEKALKRWRELHAAHVGAVEGQSAPSANDQYLFYQSLVGIWPPEPLTAETFQSVPQRIGDYMQKAIKEAKEHSSWINPNDDYDAAVRYFVTKVLNNDPNDPFRQDMADFIKPMALCGYMNSLSQVVLKLTSPGVPDFYQGTELWDFSLVDPDNRRPVDYQLRRCRLSELRDRIAKAPDQLVPLVQELLAKMEDGRIKLYIMTQLLAHRSRHRDLYKEGAYQPLESTGAREAHVCAYLRHREATAILIVVPVQVGRLTGGKRLATGDRIWADTRLLFPEGMTPARWRNLLTGEIWTAQLIQGRAGLWLRDLLRQCPCAVLERI